MSSNVTRVASLEVPPFPSFIPVASMGDRSAQDLTDQDFDPDSPEAKIEQSHSPYAGPVNQPGAGDFYAEKEVSMYDMHADFGGDPYSADEFYSPTRPAAFSAAATSFRPYQPKEISNNDKVIGDQSFLEGDSLVPSVSIEESRTPEDVSASVSPEPISPMSSAERSNSSAGSSSATDTPAPSATPFESKSLLIPSDKIRQDLEYRQDFTTRIKDSFLADVVKTQEIEETSLLSIPRPVNFTDLAIRLVLKQTDADLKLRFDSLQEGLNSTPEQKSFDRLLFDSVIEKVRATQAKQLTHKVMMFGGTAILKPFVSPVNSENFIELMTPSIQQRVKWSFTQEQYMAAENAYLTIYNEYFHRIPASHQIPLVYDPNSFMKIPIHIREQWYKPVNVPIDCFFEQLDGNAFLEAMKKIEKALYGHIPLGLESRVPNFPIILDQLIQRKHVILSTKVDLENDSEQFFQEMDLALDKGDLDEPNLLSASKEIQKVVGEISEDLLNSALLDTVEALEIVGDQKYRRSFKPKVSTLASPRAPVLKSFSKRPKKVVVQEAAISLPKKVEEEKEAVPMSHAVSSPPARILSKKDKVALAEQITESLMKDLFK